MLGIKRARTPAPVPDSRWQMTNGRWSGAVGWVGQGGRLLPGAEMVDGTPVSVATDESVLALPAAWRCANIITNGVGMLNIDGIDNREDPPCKMEETPDVLADPWPVISPMNWKVQIIMSLLLRGNAYCIQADPDPSNGYPRQLPVLHPDDVEVRVEDGMVLYFVNGNGPYGPMDIWQVRGPCMPGEVVGMGVIEVFRRALGSAMDLNRYGDATFSEGAVPPVVLQIERPELSRPQAEDIQNRWMEAHGYGSRKPAVIPNSINVRTFAFSPEDAQYLASRQQSAVEICWMFGVDPRSLGLAAGTGTMTYANLEMAQAGQALESFMPWTTRIEQMLSRCLPRRVEARFDYSPRLRPTLMERYRAYKLGIDGGWLTVDDVRVAEGMEPLSEEATKGAPPAVPVGNVGDVAAVIPDDTGAASLSVVTMGG